MKNFTMEYKVSHGLLQQEDFSEETQKSIEQASDRDYIKSLPRFSDAEALMNDILKDVGNS
ncbi:hypothetical protein FACS1894152_8170 [Bacilli bacterium]|nr:hypothetical protein FACS1894152_8170 [Bacilli bacterium]